MPGPTARSQRAARSFPKPVPPTMANIARRKRGRPWNCCQKSSTSGNSLGGFLAWARDKVVQFVPEATVPFFKREEKTKGEEEKGREQTRREEKRREEKRRKTEGAYNSEVVREILPGLIRPGTNTSYNFQFGYRGNTARPLRRMHTSPPPNLEDKVPVFPQRRRRARPCR